MCLTLLHTVYRIRSTVLTAPHKHPILDWIVLSLSTEEPKTEGKCVCNGEMHKAFYKTALYYTQGGKGFTPILRILLRKTLSKLVHVRTFPNIFQNSCVITVHSWILLNSCHSTEGSCCVSDNLIQRISVNASKGG